jgi:hypothetical protein
MMINHQILGGYTLKSHGRDVSYECFRLDSLIEAPMNLSSETIVLCPWHFWVKNPRNLRDCSRTIFCQSDVLNLPISQLKAVLSVILHASRIAHWEGASAVLPWGLLARMDCPGMCTEYEAIMKQPILGGFHKWGYPNSWMFYDGFFKKWMIWVYPYDIMT